MLILFVSCATYETKIKCSTVRVAVIQSGYEIIPIDLVLRLCYIAINFLIYFILETSVDETTFEYLKHQLKREPNIIF